MFKPALTDNAFKTWNDNGLKTVKYLFLNNTFGSFVEFIALHDIPRSHFFRYLQLQSFVSANLKCFPSIPVETLSDKIFKMCPSLQETIGKIYALLNSEKSLEVVRSKWEEELGINITDDEWQDIIDGIQSSSICQRHRVIQFKVVHRLHWSEVKPAQIKFEVDGLCDRCRADDGTLAHVFYHCPKLTEFWKSIFSLFFPKVLKIDIKPFSITTFFGVADTKWNLNTRGKTIISFSTLLAR